MEEVDRDSLAFQGDIGLIDFIDGEIKSNSGGVEKLLGYSNDHEQRTDRQGDDPAVTVSYIVEHHRIYVQNIN